MVHDSLQRLSAAHRSNTYTTQRNVSIVLKIQHALQIHALHLLLKENGRNVAVVFFVVGATNHTRNRQCVAYSQTAFGATPSLNIWTFRTDRRTSGQIVATTCSQCSRGMFIALQSRRPLR